MILQSEQLIEQIIEDGQPIVGMVRNTFKHAGLPAPTITQINDNVRAQMQKMCARLGNEQQAIQKLQAIQQQMQIDMSPENWQQCLQGYQQHIETVISAARKAAEQSPTPVEPEQQAEAVLKAVIAPLDDADKFW